VVVSKALDAVSRLQVAQQVVSTWFRVHDMGHFQCGDFSGDNHGDFFYLVFRFVCY
jgi:hypothetical protein